MEVWDACNFLHSGLRVKIVDSWADGDDFDPKMDRWLGEVMTVKDIRYGGRVIMEEDAGECRRHFADDGHWFWHPSMTVSWTMSPMATRMSLIFCPFSHNSVELCDLSHIIIFNI